MPYTCRHIALICDGNRRWAQTHGLSSAEGHQKGLISVLPALADHAFRNGVRFVTAWIFACRNWNRSQDEVDELMRLAAMELPPSITPVLSRHGARYAWIGRRDRVPERVRNNLEALEEESRSFIRGEDPSPVFVTALDYDGHDELERAQGRFIQAGGAGSITDYLDTAVSQIGPVDLLIRSSGEQRLSDFMPLQAACAEFVFRQEMFPEFTAQVLDLAHHEYAGRKQRWGR